LQTPRGALPPLSQLFNPEHASPAVLGTVGDLLWLVVYVVAIRRGFKDRTYGIPLVAVALNFTWELYFTLLHPPPEAVAHAAHVAWLLIDAVIVWQVFRFGREQQTIPELRTYFYPAVVGLLVLALAGHVTLHGYQVNNSIFPDDQGIMVAFFINLVMSILFVSLFFRRPDRKGLSYTVAWGKLLGTASISLANLLVYFRGSARSFELQFREAGTQAWTDGGIVGANSFHPGFAMFLFGSIFLFDVIYLVLLSRGRRRSLA